MLAWYVARYGIQTAQNVSNCQAQSGLHSTLATPRWVRPSSSDELDRVVQTQSFILTIASTCTVDDGLTAVTSWSQVPHVAGLTVACTTALAVMASSATFASKLEENLGG